MKSINQVFLLGRLGQDPEQSRTASGKDITKFSLATNFNVRVDDGWEPRTEWHKVVAFDWQAKHAAERLTKGDPVCVQGRLSCNKWTDDKGQKRVTWSVIARELTFLSPRRDDAPRDLGMGPTPPGGALPPPRPADTQADADIPF
jgi:single-strand DNA-binding protein